MKKDQTITSAAAALGKRGGTARAKALTPARRKAIATKAVTARWAKWKKSVK